MKAYVISTYYESCFNDYEKILRDYPFIKKYNYKAVPTTYKWYFGGQTIYNRHQVEFNDINEFCSFIKDCLDIGKEVIVTRKDDDDIYFTIEIYNSYRE